MVFLAKKLKCLGISNVYLLRSNYVTKRYILVGGYNPHRG